MPGHEDIREQTALVTFNAAVAELLRGVAKGGTQTKTRGPGEAARAKVEMIECQGTLYSTSKPQNDLTE